MFISSNCIYQCKRQCQSIFREVSKPTQIYVIKIIKCGVNENTIIDAEVNTVISAFIVYF